MKTQFQKVSSFAALQGMPVAELEEIPALFQVPSKKQVSSFRDSITRRTIDNVSDAAINMALAEILSDYQRQEIGDLPEIPVERIVVQRGERTIKAKKEKVRSTVSLKGTPSLPLNLPSIGTYDASSFLAAINRRGTDRDESIRLIAGYVGYYPAEDYGIQEFQAREKARFAMKPEKPAEFKRCKVNPSIAGYVCGKGDPVGKRIADLEGRESLATDQMAEYDRLAKEASNEIDQLRYTGFAAVEQERIRAIQSDLDLLLLARR